MCRLGSLEAASCLVSFLPSLCASLAGLVRTGLLGPAGVAAVGRAGAAAVGPAGVAGELFELISPSNLRAVWLRKEFVTDYFQNGLLINAAYYFTLYAFYTPPTNRLIMQKPNFLSWRMFAPGRFCSK